MKPNRCLGRALSKDIPYLGGAIGAAQKNSSVDGVIFVRGVAYSTLDTEEGGATTADPDKGSAASRGPPEYIPD
jgi:hypothetical protein